MLFFTLLAAASALLQNCNTSSVFQITELALTPDPPIPGEPFVMTIVFNNPGDPITNGTATSTLSINYMPLPTSTVLLCNSTTCPIQTGKNDRSTKNVWPTAITGYINGKMKWYDTYNNELLCIHTSFTVSTSLWRSLITYLITPLCGTWITC